MAANNFDSLTRALASSTSRRQTIKALVAGAGGLLGLGSLGTALAADDACFANGKKCVSNSQCCSATCGANGVCTCRAKGLPCSSNKQCCSKKCTSSKACA